MKSISQNWPVRRGAGTVWPPIPRPRRGQGTRRRPKLLSIRPFSTPLARVITGRSIVTHPCRWLHAWNDAIAARICSASWHCFTHFFLLTPTPPQSICTLNMASDYAEVDSSRIMRLQPTASLNFQYAPSYSSVASDEIELVNTHGTPIRYPPKSKRFGTGLFKFGNKNRALKKTEKSWTLLRRRLVTRVLLLFVILGLLVLLIMMSAFPFAFTQDTGGVCKPDGTFELSFDAYTPWKRDGIFAINIKFGRLSFGLAKFLDVSWDIVSYTAFQLLFVSANKVRWLVGEARHFWPYLHT